MGKVLDIHVHIGEDYSKKYTGEAAIEIMDKNNIDYAVISPVPMYPAPDGVESTKRQNDYIAEMLVKHSDRFIKGLGVVNPRHGKATLKEVERIFKELCLAGMMFSNEKTGISMDNPIMYDFIEAIPKEIDPIMLMHTSYFSVLEPPFMLEKLARKFPNINFINAASMACTTHANCSRFLASNYENIYLDTACIHYIHHPIFQAVQQGLENKLLFGTDSPFYSISFDKLIVEDGEVSPEIKEKILYNNARELFGLSDM